MVECAICLRPAIKLNQIEKGIKVLLTKAYKLVNVPVKDDDSRWNFLESSTNSCWYYCDKCRQDFNLLRNGLEVVVKAQEQLKACLDRIEAILVEARAPQKSGSRPRKRKIVVVAEEDEVDEITQHSRYSDDEGQANEDTNTGDEWTNDEEDSSSSSSSSSDSDDGPSSKRKKSEPSSEQTNDEPSRLRWITCGIDSCEETFSYKKLWTRHAHNKHPSVDLKQHWGFITAQKTPKMFVCKFDGCRKKKFGTKAGYIIHVKKNHPWQVGLPQKKKEMEVVGFTTHCDICRERFPKPQLPDHIRAHVGEYALSCPNPDCPRVYGTLRNLKFHLAERKGFCMKFATEKDKFAVCQVCSFAGTTHQGLHNHLKLVHEATAPKTLPCPMSGCSEMFANRQTVYFHVSQRHASPRAASLLAKSSSQHCPECSVQVDFDQIPDHFQNSHGVSMESAFSCKYCPYKAITHLQLIDHFHVHFRAGISVSCDICPEEKKFSRLANLRQHYLDRHQIGNSYVCEHCSKVFTVETALKEHIKKYHSGRPRPNWHQKLKCDLCPPDNPQRYLNTDNLMRHKIVDHGAEPFKCTTCLKTFNSWAILRNHLKFVHKNLARKTYPCDIPGCSHVAVSPADLAIHKASIKHVGRMNSFQCDQCEMGFNTKSRLHNHKNHVHVAERKFVCDVCGMAFKHREALVQHSRIHTGEKPYQCHLCPKRFRQGHHLKGHLTTHKASDQPIS